MKKEVRLLLGKAIDSLIISVEHFNRPSDQGRVPAVLIMLDHAFEMFLKAAQKKYPGLNMKASHLQKNGCVRKDRFVRHFHARVSRH